MKKTGVFYGSSTGTCEELANQIAEKLRVSSTDVHSVDKMTADKIKEYEVLVLGTSTWGDGELQDDWYDAMHSLKGLPHVCDIRTIGLIAGIELSSRDGAPGARAYDVFVDCFEKGLLIRVTGDIIAFSPPLIAEKKHFEDIVSILGDALKRAA